jgi:hypothetical protein
VLTSGLQLSTPSVLEGSNYVEHLEGAVIQERLGFRSDLGSFWVTALSRCL